MPLRAGGRDQFVRTADRCLAHTVRGLPFLFDSTGLAPIVTEQRAVSFFLLFASARAALPLSGFGFVRFRFGVGSGRFRQVAPSLRRLVWFRLAVRFAGFGVAFGSALPSRSVRPDDVGRTSSESF
jgi:hypothetical protein